MFERFKRTESAEEQPVEPNNETTGHGALLGKARVSEITARSIGRAMRADAQPHTTGVWNPTPPGRR